MPAKIVYQAKMKKAEKKRLASLRSRANILQWVFLAMAEQTHG